MTLQNLLNKLWEEDPGYFRLKRSSKTVIAILIIGILSFDAPLLVKFFAAITAGFSMQAIVGETRKAQVYFILIAFPIYFICFILGYLSKDSNILSSSLLVILGFTAIYIKKLGPEFNLGPIIAWSFAFFGIILPITSQTQWLTFGSLAFGFLISALVYLFIFPELNSKLFYSNVSKFFKEYSIILQWLAHILIHKVDYDKFLVAKEKSKGYLFQLTVVNGDITQNHNETENLDTVRMYQIYIKQYALAKVVSMIFEAFDHLILQKLTISEIIRSHLFTVFAIYATAISNIEIRHTHSNYQEILNTLAIMEKNLGDFQEVLLSCIVMQKQSIIALVNLNLGLRLIFKNIQALEQIYEK